MAQDLLECGRPSALLRTVSKGYFEEALKSAKSAAKYDEPHSAQGSLHSLHSCPKMAACDPEFAEIPLTPPKKLAVKKPVEYVMVKRKDDLKDPISVTCLAHSHDLERYPSERIPVGIPPVRAILESGIWDGPEDYDLAPPSTLLSGASTIMGKEMVPDSPLADSPGSLFDCQDNSFETISLNSQPKFLPRVEAINFVHQNKTSAWLSFNDSMTSENALPWD